MAARRLSRQFASVMGKADEERGFTSLTAKSHRAAQIPLAEQLHAVRADAAP